MGLITINRIKTNGVFYFIVCDNFQSALSLGQTLASLVGNEFVNVLEFRSREEILLYCENIILE